MFCKECGKEITGSSKFCGGCGAAVNNVKPSENYTQIERTTPLMEAISFTENPSREQTTIDMHQKFGWSLKNSQEINTSTTYVHGQSYNGTGHVNSYIVKEHYVKLTFERNKRMRNYNILKNMYDEFTVLAKEIEALEASIYKRSGLFYLACCIPSIIMFIIIVSAVPGGFSSFFWFPMLIMCAAFIPIVMVVASKAAESSTRRKVEPQINAKYGQMGAIADEAERYL